MSAPHSVLKIIWAEGDDADFARRLFQRIDEVYVQDPDDWPVFQFVADDDDPATFVAFTTCGWGRIGREAFKLGRIGFRRFIGTRAHWDENKQRVVLR